MLYTIQTPKETSYLYLMPLLFSFMQRPKNLGKKELEYKKNNAFKSIFNFEKTFMLSK